VLRSPGFCHYRLKTEEGFHVRGLPILVGALALATTAFAQDDPIAIRQALMSNNGAAAALAGGMLKDEVAYSPVAGKAVIEALSATAHAFGSFFPEGSADPTRSKASPKIWEDAAGFRAALDKFRADVAAAREAAGKDGPADKAAFAAAIQPVLGNCRSCHEGYRLSN
jgi:cytochrome c556